MESQRFEKTGGEGGRAPLGHPPNSDTGISLTDSSEPLLCQYRDARGRGCRMPVTGLSFADESAPDDISTDGLCTFHARRLRDRHRDGQAVAAELLASITDFADAASVNRFLGNLVKMVALRRIPRRDATVLAYLSQLLLNSQSAQDRGELLRYQLELLQKKNAPFRLIWDLPRRHTEDQSQNSESTENPDAKPGQ